MAILPQNIKWSHVWKCWFWKDHLNLMMGQPESGIYGCPYIPVYGIVTYHTLEFVLLNVSSCSWRAIDKVVGAYFGTWAMCIYFNELRERRVMFEVWFDVFHRDKTKRRLFYKSVIYLWTSRDKLIVYGKWRCR